MINPLELRPNKIKNFTSKTFSQSFAMYQELIWDALHDLEPFVQFKEHEKHPWRSVTLSKINTPMDVFHVF